MTTEPTSPATELCGDQLFGWTCTLPAGPHPDCKHRGNGHWWDQTRPVPEAPAPLSPQREQEIRETHPGEWYDGPWTQDYVDSNGDEPAYCRVVHHESGTTLATLPDFAGSIALFIADAHDAVPELLATLDAERAKVAALEKRVAELDRALDETIGDRDRAQDAADKLAYAIAPIEVIGEHSPENDPWTNALEHVTPAAEVDELRGRLVATELLVERARDKGNTQIDTYDLVDTLGLDQGDVR